MGTRGSEYGSADHGWLKLFGGGTADMPAFLDLMTSGLRAGMCAIDVLGGVFALNWGAFPGAHHRIWYWAPATLAWLECGEWTHFDLVWSALTGGLDRFYEDLRWPGWQDDVAQLDADQGYTLMPQPFSVEGRDVALSHKAVVPMAEICRVMYMFTGPGGVFDGTSDRYPMFWLRGPHARPDIDRFTD
ncbi:DUF2625 family protein [Mycobacterium sp. MS1601]|uniref:DUF2625 family protein n=1 Tax=Mycobacterium sp. MS1601 TaxID=1936029 RepID=UPI0012F95519|nr:DUF2625 family protein [Mycobacterium sp. MS1601]